MNVDVSAFYCYSCDTRCAGGSCAEPRWLVGLPQAARRKLSVYPLLFLSSAKLLKPHPSFSSLIAPNQVLSVHRERARVRSFLHHSS